MCTGITLEMSSDITGAPHPGIRAVEVQEAILGLSSATNSETLRCKRSLLAGGVVHPVGADHEAHGLGLVVLHLAHLNRKRAEKASLGARA